MTYKEINILHKYLYNKVDEHKFEELMLKTDTFFNDSYINGKWENFKVNMHAFTFTWESFFNEVVKDIENTKYEG